MRTKIAIIVVTYNNQRHVPALFESILKNVNLNQTPVVVVDNNSSDSTTEVIESFQLPNLTLIKESTNHGFGVANNIGMSAVDADYYFLLNSDAFFISNSHEYVASLLDCNPGIGIAGVPLIFPDGAPQTYAYPYTAPVKLMLQVIHVDILVKWLTRLKYIARLLRLFPLGRSFVQSQVREKVKFEDYSTCFVAEGVLEDVDWVCGAAMMLSKPVIEKTGGFDRNIFLYGEDEDLCISARKQGFRVVTVGAVPVVHEFGWGSSKKGSSRIDAKLHSLYYFVDKHFVGGKRVFMKILITVKLKGILRGMSEYIR